MVHVVSCCSFACFLFPFTQFFHQLFTKPALQWKWKVQKASHQLLLAGGWPRPVETGTPKEASLAGESLGRSCTEGNMVRTDGAACTNEGINPTWHWSVSPSLVQSGHARPADQILDGKLRHNHSTPREHFSSQRRGKLHDCQAGQGERSQTVKN